MIPAVLGALGRFDRDKKLTPYGIFFMRMTLVAIWIAHFWYKVGYRGMPATVQFFGSLGYPDWFAWADVTAEAVAIVMLACGIYVRTLCPLLLIIIILVPATMVWIPKGFYFVSSGYEFMLTWCILQLVQTLLGPGAFCLRWPEPRAYFAVRTD